MKKILQLIVIVFSITAYGQIDSSYYYNSKKILDNYPKSRVKAEVLFNSAKKIYDEKGVIVPYELAISQAIVETSLGNKGVGKKRNNPFSLNSKKGYRVYSSIENGILDYYYFISFYLKCRTTEQLFKNFVNCSGNRYASSKKYERNLKKVLLQFKKL
jgi:flagellum-specific peptidoglycan hydrolase FlgJ